MGDAIVYCLLDVMPSASFKLNVFSGAMRRARDCRELAQCEEERMVVENGLRREL